MRLNSDHLILRLFDQTGVHVLEQ